MMYLARDAQCFCAVAPVSCRLASTRCLPCVSGRTFLRKCAFTPQSNRDEEGTDLGTQASRTMNRRHSVCFAALARPGAVVGLGGRGKPRRKNHARGVGPGVWCAGTQGPGRGQRKHSEAPGPCGDHTVR